MVVYVLNLWDPNVNPIAKFATIGHLVNVILPLLIIGAAILLLVMLLYGGFSWITAGGNPENLGKAQKTMTFAIIGLAIVILSFVVVKLITNIFNIEAPL